MLIVLQAFFLDGIEPYRSIREYSCQNEGTEGLIAPVQNNTASQTFTAKGNIINNISVFLTNTDSKAVDISLMDSDGKVLQKKTVNLDEYQENVWNKIPFECKIKRNSIYTLCFQSEQNLDFLLYDMGEKPASFLACEIPYDESNESASGKDVGTDASLVIGIPQTYSYVTFASALELCFSCLTAVLIALALCYAVFHIESLIKTFSEPGKKKGLPYAIYFALSLVSLYNPIDVSRTSVDSFDRVIGIGLINNIDPSKRNANFNHWFLYFAVSLVLLYLLANYCLQKNARKEAAKVREFLNQFMILADINLLFCCITYFADKETKQTLFRYSSFLIMLVVLVCVGYLVLGLDRKIQAESFLKLEIIAFCAAFPVAILSQLEWPEGKLLFGFQAMFMLLVLPFSYCCGKALQSRKGLAGIHIGTMAAALIPFATSFYIELVNILNQHNVYVTHLRKNYVLGMALLAGAALLLTVCIVKKNIAPGKWKTWSYVWLIFGMACLYAQIPLERLYSLPNDSTFMYENANYSILISDFLNFGKIPLVEHYGGHMMAGVWEGLLYALLNNDAAGAVFSPYSEYIIAILAVLFFLLVRKIWDENMALFVTLLFPFYSHWNIYGLGMLVCLAVWAYIKKNTYFRAALVWLAFIWCAIYRLDLGTSFGIACILAMILYVIVDKNKKAAKQLSLTLAGWGVTGVTLWTILCLVKGINPVDRLMEFLLISMSNQNWGYAEIGPKNAGMFAWCYLLIPFAVIGCLLYVIFSKSFKDRIGNEIWLTLLILGFAYVVNFTRGLVRHSLFENAYDIIFWDAYIFLAIFAACFRNKKEWLLPTFAMLILCGSFLTTTQNYQYVPIAEVSVSKVGNYTQSWTIGKLDAEDNESTDLQKTYWRKISERGERAVRTQWDDSLKETMKPYQTVLNTLLEDDETYVDFINSSFAYSVINREDPVYVSQSPLQLSGEFTQEKFIEEIQDVPVVLMPINNDHLSIILDSIPNAYRYYKIAEYIYQNYRPLCSCGSSFAVWCLPERYEEYREKLQPLSSAQEGTEISFIDYGYDAPTECRNEDGTVYYSYDNGFHTYNISYLANIWAENDDAANNPVLCALEKAGDVYVFDRGQIQSDENGNYLLLSAYYGGTDTGINYKNNDEVTSAVIKLGTYEDGRFIEKYQYSFAVKEGFHDYLIRISTDYNWYLDDVNAVMISSGGALHDVSMKILQGD